MHVNGPRETDQALNGRCWKFPGGCHQYKEHGPKARESPGTVWSTVLTLKESLSER